MAVMNRLWRESFLLITALLCCSSSKLNVPKLLLPYYSQMPTSFKLEASDGCFFWKSTRPEVASVEPVDVDDPTACSQSAIVTAILRVPSRKTAVVVAEDTATGQSLRCDVFVDKIGSVEIETTTKELFLDDSPEEFVMRATNDKEDVFSSLNGIEFDWNLQLDSEAGSRENISPQNVLRILKFSESAYTAQPYIKSLEDQGKRGDRILMRGLHVGAAVISVKPSDPVYKHVPESRVRIIVVANLQLSPSVAYIMQHATVQYTVHLMKQSQAFDVAMPNQDYYIEVENTTVASFDESASTARGLEFGAVELKLKTRNALLAGTFREPSAGLYVVLPGYLEFAVFPGRSWVLQTNQVYNIQVEIFDKESHKLYPSENIRVVAHFPESYFRVISASKNGTYYVVETLQRGYPLLIGELQAVVTQNGREFMFTPPVEGRQEVAIFDPILLLPKVLVLPWDTEQKSLTYKLNVTGGSGNYTWHSSETQTANVNSAGVLITTGRIGATSITAADVRHSGHNDTSQVYVIPPSRIEFLDAAVEAQIGTLLRLPLALYGRLDDKEVKFDDCHSIKFAIRISDEAVFKHVSIVEPIVDGSCASLVVEALTMGHVDVTAVYKHGNVQLKTSVTIAAYRPLKVIDPVNVAVVTVGASLTVVFDGGPQPWVLDPSKYLQKTDITNNQRVKIIKVQSHQSSSHKHVFRVKCISLGDEEVMLTVGNEPTLKNKYPAVVSASVSFACEEPKNIQLMPLLSPSNLPCPISVEKDDMIPVPPVGSVTLLVTVTDSLGRKFDNFSSLIIDWSVSDPSIGQLLVDKAGVTVTTDEYDKHLSRAATLELRKKVGQLLVSVEARKYNNSYTQHWVISPKLSTPVTSSRTLNVVNYPSLAESTVSIYNHPDSKTLLEIIDGTGFFHLDYEPSVPYMANVTYTEAKPRKIIVQPVHEGSMVITIKDRCLSPLKPFAVSVIISDIASITIDVIDKVQVGNEITAVVRVLDHGQRPIRRDHFEQMALKLTALGDKVSIRPVADASYGDDYSASYIIRGLVVGDGDLSAKATKYNSKTVTSATRKIWVFPPLVLEPKNITLVVDSVFQIRASGGPRDSTVVYSVQSDAIGTINHNGLINARKVGNTVITARATGQEMNGKVVVYSQDTAILNVVELIGVKIRAPLKWLRAGTEMPLYAMGVGSDLEPFSFAGVANQLKYSWSINNQHLASLRPPFHMSGLVSPENGTLAMRLLVHDAGQIVVSLKVTYTHSITEIFTDSIVIQVFEKLKITSPAIADGEILVTPSTTFEVRTNRAGSSSKVYYGVTDCSGTCSADACPNMPLSVGPGGLLTSAAHTGQACLLVTSHEDFGVNQSIVVLVKVKPISYMMINSDTVLHVAPGSRITAFPTAMPVSFFVSFHDNFGVEFYATHHKVVPRLNRYDWLNVKAGKLNNTLIATPNNEGMTILKVLDESDLSQFDYTGVEFRQAIQPFALTVTVGSVICFVCPFVSAEGRSGDWVSLSSAVAVNRETGIAQVVYVTSTVVKYNVSSALSTEAEVNVVPITKISLLTTNVSFITNVPLSKGRSYPSLTVVLENEAKGLTASIQGSNCSESIRHKSSLFERFPFRCEAAFATSNNVMTLDQIMHFMPAFDPLSGNYKCLVVAEKAVDDLQFISTIQSEIHLRAVVTETTGQREVVSDVVKFDFIPAFHVLTTEIHVSNMQPVGHIRLSASDVVIKNLVVTSSDAMLVYVQDGYMVDPLSADRIYEVPVELQVAVMLWKGAPEIINVEIKCVVTGQVHVVPVRIVKSSNTDMSIFQVISAIYSSIESWAMLLIPLCFLGSMTYYTRVLQGTTTVGVMPIEKSSHNGNLSILSKISHSPVIAVRLAGGHRQQYIPPVQPISPPTMVSPPPWSPPVYAGGSPNDTSARLWSVDRSPYNSSLSKRSPQL